jgi:hypothetical protein
MIANRCEHPVDVFHREGLGIEAIAYPLADFFVPIMFRVNEGLDKFVVSGDSAGFQISSAIDITVTNFPVLGETASGTEITVPI